MLASLMFGKDFNGLTWNWKHFFYFAWPRIFQTDCLIFRCVCTVHLWLECVDMMLCFLLWEQIFPMGVVQQGMTGGFCRCAFAWLQVRLNLLAGLLRCEVLPYSAAVVVALLCFCLLCNVKCESVVKNSNFVVDYQVQVVSCVKPISGLALLWNHPALSCCCCYLFCNN